MADDFLPNDHWVTDGKTGTKIRARDARTQWDGTVTHKDRFETRHPQEFVRVRPETASVKDPRPPQPAVYQGPLKTLLADDHVAGDTLLTVDSSARFEAGDRIHILLDNGEPCERIIQSIPDATSIQLIVGLAWAATTGNVVTNYTALAPSNIE